MACLHDAPNEPASHDSVRGLKEAEEIVDEFVRNEKVGKVSDTRRNEHENQILETCVDVHDVDQSAPRTMLEDNIDNFVTYVHDRR